MTSSVYCCVIDSGVVAVFPPALLKSFSEGFKGLDSVRAAPSSQRGLDVAGALLRQASRGEMTLALFFLCRSCLRALSQWMLQRRSEGALAVGSL